MKPVAPHKVAHLRDAFASLEGDARRSIDSGRIFDALHGDVSVEQRRALVDELLTDGDAAEAWRLALELAPEPHARPRAFLVRRGGWMSMAAAAALVAMIGWQLTAPQRPADQPSYRGFNGPRIASALPPGVAITRVTPTLRWTGVEGARYRVRVLRTDLTVIAQSDELTLTEYTLKSGALDQIPAGAQILWQVTAHIPTEGIVESPTFYARVE